MACTFINFTRDPPPAETTVSRMVLCPGGGGGGGIDAEEVEPGTGIDLAPQRCCRDSTDIKGIWAVTLLIYSFVTGKVIIWKVKNIKKLKMHIR